MTTPTTTRTRRVSLVTAARSTSVAAAVAALWLLLSGSREAPEIVAAIAVGIGTAWFGARLRRYVGHQQGGLRRWVAHLPRMVGRAYLDCWTLTRVLVARLRGRPTAGRMRWMRYQVGDDEPDDVGRRVLTVFGATLQPASYVLAFDHEAEAVLVHELVPTVDGPIPASLRAPRGPASTGGAA